MSLLAVLAALLPGLIPKKAPYCLWVLTVKRVTLGTVSTWENRNPSGNSARRCGKAAKKYIDKGVPESSIMILPKGIPPPPIGG